MSDKLKREAAERIYLQLCDDSMSEWYNEVTWCEDRVHDEDVEYVRADVVERLRADLARAEENARCGWQTANINEKARQEEMAKRDKAEAELAAIKGQEPISLDEFAEWFCRQVPSGTVVGDPGWWAGRIFRKIGAAPVADKDAEPVAESVLVSCLNGGMVVDGELWICIPTGMRDD